MCARRPDKRCEQIDPSGAQRGLALTLTGINPLAFSGSQEVGADIGQALARHTDRHRIDGGEPGADRRQIEPDSGRFVPQQGRNPLHRRHEVAPARRGQLAGAIEGREHRRQGHTAAVGVESGFGVSCAFTDLLSGLRAWSRTVSGGLWMPLLEIRDYTSI